MLIKAHSIVLILKLRNCKNYLNIVIKNFLCKFILN